MGFPANEFRQDHGQARKAQQGDAVACAGQGQSWRRSHGALCASSSTRAMQWDVLSKAATPSELSASFQGAVRNPSDPHAKRVNQPSSATSSRAGAHVLGCFTPRNLRVKGTTSSHSLTFPALHVTQLSCAMTSMMSSHKV